MYPDSTKKIDKIGKTQARARFLPLVKSVGQGHPIAITERNKPIAVMISWSQYLKFASAAGKKRSHQNKLLGSLKIVGDLEKGSREIAKLFEESLNASVKNL